MATPCHTNESVVLIYNTATLSLLTNEIPLLGLGESYMDILGIHLIISKYLSAYFLFGTDCSLWCIPISFQICMSCGVRISLRTFSQEVFHGRYILVTIDSYLESRSNCLKRLMKLPGSFLLPTLSILFLRWAWNYCCYVINISLLHWLIPLILLLTKAQRHFLYHLLLI